MSEVNVYRCLNCNAPIAYNAGLEKWKCEYCNSEFTDDIFIGEKNDHITYISTQKKKFIKEQDDLLEKVLVLLGFIQNSFIQKQLEGSLKLFELEEPVVDTEKVVNERLSNEKIVIEKEEEIQFLSIINQLMKNNGDLSFDIVDEEGVKNSLKGKFSTYKELTETLSKMSLIEIKHLYKKKYTLSSEYFSPMGIAYLLQLGKLREINFLNTKDSLDDEGVKNESTIGAEQVIYRCSSCGAELLVGDNVSATFCCYCKSSAIIKERFNGKFRPQWVIPFEINEDEAKEIYYKWIKRSIFTPQTFKNHKKIGEIKGVYVPVWLFDCFAIGKVSGRGQRIYDLVAKKHAYKVKQFYSIAEFGSAVYEKVPIIASEQLGNDTLELLEPYNYLKMKDFSEAYMSGFMAHVYDVEGEVAEKIFDKKIAEYFEIRLKLDVENITHISVDDMKCSIMDVEKHYTLMPMYILTIPFNGKNYQYVINGQTGKLAGEAPKSSRLKMKFATIVFVITLLFQVLGGVILNG